MSVVSTADFVFVSRKMVCGVCVRVAMQKIGAPQLLCSFPGSFLCALIERVSAVVVWCIYWFHDFLCYALKNCVVVLMIGGHYLGRVGGGRGGACDGDLELFSTKRSAFR